LEKYLLESRVFDRLLGFISRPEARLSDTAAP
jgi:hypothetical protein